MAANIGGTNCTFVKGTIPTAVREVTRRFRRAGIDGHGAVQTGKGDSSYVLRAILYGTKAAINTWATAIEAMQGTVIAVENDFGDTHGSSLADRVTPPRKSAAKKPNSSQTTRGEMQIMLTALS